MHHQANKICWWYIL